MTRPARRLWPAIGVALVAVVLASVAGVLAFGPVPTALAFAAVLAWLTAEELADRATVDDPGLAPAATRPPTTPAPGDVAPATRPEGDRP